MAENQRETKAKEKQQTVTSPFPDASRGRGNWRCHPKVKTDGPNDRLPILAAG
jgi:hypothetical protein